MVLQIPLSQVTSVIDGLKKLYVEKLKPLEVTYLFNDFVSSFLVSFSCGDCTILSNLLVLLSCGRMILHAIEVILNFI